jgi:translocation and assembly module TamB
VNSLVKWVVGGFLAIILLLVILFGLLQTGAAKSMVASVASSALSSEPDRRVVIEDLEGLLPLNFRVARVSVSDAEGEWLNLSNLVLRWSPSRSFVGRVWVDEIGASSIRIDRLPQGNEGGGPLTDTITGISEKLESFMIERLSVDELFLGTPVLGHSGLFAVEGGVGRVGPDPERRVFLRVERKDEGPKTIADINVSYLKDSQILGVKAEFLEDSNGWVATVLGFHDTSPLQLTLEGEGPLADWKGILQGSMGDLGSVIAQIGLAVERETAVTLHGKHLPSVVSSRLEPLIGTENIFSIEARVAPSQSFTLERATFLGKGYSARLSGRMDLESRSVAGDWAVGVRDLRALEPLVGTQLSGDLTVSGTVSGNLRHPKWSMLAVSRRMQAEGFSMERVQTQLNIEPLDSSFSAFQISGSGSAMELGALDGRILPERSLQWVFDARVPMSERISIGELLVMGESHFLRLTGHADPATRRGSFDIVTYAKDMEPITGLVKTGSSFARAKFDWDLKALSASGTISGQISPSLENAPSYIQLFGPQLVFAGKVSTDDGSRFNISSLQILSPHLELKGDSRIDLSGRTVKGSWQLKTPDLESIGKIIERPVTGSIEAKGEVAGSFSALEYTASLKGSDLVWDGRTFQEVSAEIRARDLPGSPKGKLSVAVRREEERLSASSDFAYEARLLALSSLVVEGPGSRFQGEIKLDTQKALAQGSVDGKFRDLSALGIILGEGLKGSAEVQARFSPGKEGQDVKVSFKGNQLETPAGSAQDVTLAADLKDVLNTPKGTLDLAVKGFERPGLTLSALNFKASGDAKGAELSASTSGRMREEFELQIQGNLARGEKSDQLRVKTLSGRVADHQVKLLQPAVFARSEKGLSLESLALSVGRGSLKASGQLTQGRALIDAEFKGIPVDTATFMEGPPFSGNAAGTLRVEGEPARPSAVVDLKVTNFRSGRPALKGVSAGTLIARARLERGQLNVTGELQRVEEGAAKAELTAPLDFSLTPFAFSMPPQGPLQGYVEGSTDLAVLTTFIPHENHELSGPFNVRFDLGGTVADPRLSGSGTVKNGSYQNLSYGTVLRNISTEIVARGRRLEVVNLRATDGEKGTISGSGWVNLEAGESFGLEINAKVSDATLARRHDLTGSASGEIRLTGSAKELVLTGTLNVRSSEVTIGRSTSRSITELDVIEIHGPADLPVEKEGATEPQSPSSLRVDLRVNIPSSHLFIRGRGLESEWQGDFHITGPANRLAITGTLNVVRGNFDFLGRRFNLTNGIIRYYGSIPPAPTLDITGETRAREITTRLVLSGYVSAPEIQLQSDPAMPQDEILARLLFNRNLTNISPMQALRLADALRTLSGRGHTFDLVGRTREFFGLEQLELRTAGGTPQRTPGGTEEDAEGMALGIGKYLTEDVYVDVEKGVGNESGKVSVTIEITPSITLETEAGLDSRKGAGINWKRDY